MEMRRGTGGFALPVAVFALVILGVLVTGGFYTVRQEMRIGVASANAQEAFYLAERGVYNTLNNWSNGSLTANGTWNSVTVADTVKDGFWTVAVTPMTDRLFYIASTGTVTRGGDLWSGATRKVGMIARLITADIDPPAALSTLGDLNFGGSAIIDGRDTDPGQWPGLCNSPNTDKPGIMIDDEDNINFNGNETNIRNNQLFGLSDTAEDPTMTSDSLMTFGDLAFNDLAAMADKIYNSAPGSIAPVWSGSVCTTGSPANWGEPLDNTNPCFNYFPIIYLNNPGVTWTFTDGRGQGILLVEGDLKVRGQFEFYGPVIIKGTLSTEGGGGTQHFHGGVVAANVNLEDNTVLGTADIVYSSCAIERAILNSKLTRARPLAARSWVDLSAVSY